MKRFGLPVDTGLGRACSVPVVLARILLLPRWTPVARGGLGWVALSSAERRRNTSTCNGGLMLEFAGLMGRRRRLVWEDDKHSLYTEVQELDNEQEPPSLSS